MSVDSRSCTKRILTKGFDLRDIGDQLWRHTAGDCPPVQQAMDRAIGNYLAYDERITESTDSQYGKIEIGNAFGCQPLRRQ